MIFASFTDVSAQTNSRVAVTSTENKTNIWVSDFPKNATVILVDADKNILSIVSTNDFGSAFLSLNKAIKSAVIARTMNGEISATNEPVVKEAQRSETAATTIQISEIKA